jgi:Ca-activated chloride channel family protein
MMEWRVPQALWLLGLVPLSGAFFAWAMRRRRLALERFAEARLLATLTPDLDQRRQYWRAALLLTALALLIVALAGPKWGFHWEEVRREGIDLVVALDTSRSMLAEDIKPNRLERAKLAVEDLLRQLQGDRVGLVAFAGSAFVQCPLTLDYGAFGESLRAIDVGIIPRGGTALAEAIDAGVAAFEGHESKYEALVLITDGESHEGDAKQAAQKAADQGIKIYTVGIGTSDGEIIPTNSNGQRGFLKDRHGNVVKSRLDDATLKQIATTTGGAYVHAQGADLGLDELYKEYISKMDRRELKSGMERRYEERFQLLLLAAIALLAVEPFLGERRRAAIRARLLARRRSAA